MAASIHADRTYRIVKDFVNDDNSRLPDATTPSALAPAMLHEIPEVEQATLCLPRLGQKVFDSLWRKDLYRRTAIPRGQQLLRCFTFPFVEGDAATAFKDETPSS